jgi:hypothetical protein
VVCEGRGECELGLRLTKCFPSLRSMKKAILMCQQYSRLREQYAPTSTVLGVDVKELEAMGGDTSRKGRQEGRTLFIMQE